ncbi:MAG: YidC/Oxa1 family membrane protein insertase [Acidobacteriota bacterium]|nr:YidC/Oxa1 family membrane protein insertase [Acidobacteriota bacterium]
MTALVPVLGSTLGKIFQPLFQAMAWLIAFFYALVPNYAIAIALLTVVVMIVTAPLTVKSTRSMVAMQRLSPELKKLQQKYKGDRQKLNEEMMNLYKEHGVNPAGGCLPMVIQFPVFIILYDVIRGLTNTVKVHGVVTAAPRYIGHSTHLYKNLVQAKGKMPAFGIDLAQRVLGHHTGVGWLPYALLIVVAIGLQYLQMRQLNSRNPAMAQANPQAQMMQRYMPLIFAVIYINISAGVNIYFIVSSLCRIGIQEAVFRSGVLERASKPVEKTVSGSGGTPRRKSFMDRLADAQRQAIEAQQARQQALQAGTGPGEPGAPDRPKTRSGPKTQGGTPQPGGKRGAPPPGRAPGTSGGNGAGRPGGPQGKSGGDGGAAKPQPPSKPKRTRKAR